MAIVFEHRHSIPEGMTTSRDSSFYFEAAHKSQGNDPFRFNQAEGVSV